MIEDRLMKTLRTEPRIHGGGKFPCEHFPRIPVDDSDEIHKPVFQSDVGNVTSPNMILPFDPKSLQEIWIFLVPPIWNTRVPLRIECSYSECIHRSANHPSSDLDTMVAGEYFPDPPLSEVRGFGIYPIDEMKDGDGNLRSHLRFIRIYCFPADTEQFRLTDDAWNPHRRFRIIPL